MQGMQAPVLRPLQNMNTCIPIGADLVGMSAVPEVIAAHHIGLKVLAISVVSNVCYPPERIQETL